MNLKAFAGFAAWGLIAASVSLIFVFAFSTFFGSAEDVGVAQSISGFSIATSRANGDTTTSGDLVSKNDTQELFNFSLTIQGNVSNITILVPSFSVSADYANISILNTTLVQLGTNLTDWTVTYVTNFSATGGPFRIQLNTSDPTKMLGNDYANISTVWFALNGTPKINTTGPAGYSDNHTMTWYVYASNSSTANITATKITTIVDNNPPRILLTTPSLNSSSRAYIRGLSAELFQANITEAELNVSKSANNDGSTNATLWYRVSGITTWNTKTTMLCYNFTGGMSPNYLTQNMYTCNATVDLSQLGPLAVAEGDVIQFFLNASDLVLNAGYNGTQASPREVQVDRTTPASTSVATNVTYAHPNKGVSLNARFSDNFALANATLATNETNEGATVFTNYTANDTYGSPLTMAGDSYTVNFTWSNSSVPSGTIVAWQIIAKDIAGNAHAAALQTFVADADAPATLGGFISPANNANVTGNITVNVSVNDTLSGVSMVYLNISYEAPAGSIRGINNITLTQGITGYYNATINSTFNLPMPTADGNYTFRIVANDTLNNVNNSANIRVWIDNTAPVISVTLPASDQSVTGLFTIEALVTDAVRVDRVQYVLSNTTYRSGTYFQMLNTSGLLMNQSGVYNSTNMTNANVLLDGTWNVTVWANDSVNNIAQVNVSITIDNVQNATVIDWQAVNNSYANGTIRKAGQTINLNITTIGNLYGLFPSGYGYNISVYIVNSSGTAIYAGNVSNVSQFWANGSITIPTNSATNVIDDGNRTFLFKTFDNQGNLMVNGSSNLTVSIDNTAANYSNPSPANNSYITGTSAQLFRISMTEVNLNVTKNVTLYWANGPAIPSTWNSKTLLCTGTGSGLYNFVGNNYVCNTTLDLSGILNSRIVYYFFNNSNVTQPNGDLAGNGGSFGNEIIPLNTTVDRTNPAVGALLPLGSVNVSGSFALNISANNTPAGIASVSYRVTNDTFQSDSIALSLGAGTAFSGYWNGTNNTVVPGLADGLYRIVINATDNTGINANTTVNVTVTIDNTRPNVTINRPTTNLNFTTGILINATVRDGGIAYVVSAGDLQTIVYKLSNSSWSGSWIALTNTSVNGLNFDHYDATNDTSANFADGVYNITVNATDYANNFNDTQYVTIYIDRNAPTISIKSPTANQFIKGPFNISADVNDGVFVKTVFYRISNGTNVADTLGSAYLAMTNASGTNATGGGYYNATNITDAVMFGDGSYNITVAANDTVNLVTYANVTVTIDNNAPAQFGVTTNSSEPASGTEYFPGRLYRFNKTFNDTIGVTSVIMQINATNRTAFRYEGDAQGGNWSANVTDLAANTTGYPIIWYASDATGNWLTTTQWYYVLAKNTSVFTTISVNQTSVERGNYVNITIRSTTSGEINTTIYTNYTGALARLTNFAAYAANNQNITFTGYLKGIWNITANTTGTENYTANATLESVTFLVQDTARPGLRVYDYTNGTAVKPGSTINLNVSIADNYGVDSAFNVSVYFNGSTIGSWIFAGNISNSTFSSNATSSWANGTITIPASGMDEAGNKTINITILDSSGNLGMNDSFVINMDPGAPTWTNNATSPGSNIEYFPGRTYKFNLTITDEPLGVGYVALEFNGTNYTASRIAGTVYSGNWTANITDLAANSSVTGYRFRWYMNDTLGQWNTSDWLNYTIYTNTSAIARVEVNVTTVERGTYINITSYSPISALINTTIYANITTPAGVLLAVQYVPYPSGNQNITYVGSNLAVGVYNITANTTSNTNYTANSTVYMITVTVQDSSPASRFITPYNSSNFSATMNINATVTDQGGVDTVRFNISNTTWIGTTGYLNGTGNVASHYNASVNTASISEGNYNLTILANDTFGNLNSSYYFVISIDHTAPFIIFSYQLEGTRLTGYTPGNYSYRSGIISINVTVTDYTANVSNTSAVFARIGNATHWTGPQFGMHNLTLSQFNYSNLTTILADGLYNLTVTANDTVGNVRTNVTFFYADNTAPTAIALSNSTRGTYRPNTTEQIMIQVNDASQTNATIDVRAWSNNTGWTIYKTTNATPGTAVVYNVTIDTSDLVDNERIKFFVMATDNASNAATYTGSLGTPLANITINVNCGHAGTTLSYCSRDDLKLTKFGSTQLPAKSDVESITSLQSNFTIENVTKRAGIWDLFNYTYYYNGVSWLSFDPNSAPSENTLKMFNNTGAQIYLFNMNKTDVVFRIE